MQRIDAHMHFWRYIPSDFPWINNEMSALRQDRLPSHIRETLLMHKVESVVTVQARQSEAETQFLLRLADEVPWIEGVVGWIDLQSPLLGEELGKYKNVAPLKGFRHLVQDEANPAQYWKNEKFCKGVTQIQKKGYTYDLLTKSADLSSVFSFCKKHDKSLLILDHLGKPGFGPNDFETWRRDIFLFSSLSHVCVKVSGLLTEVGKGYRDEDLKPYLDTVLQIFGPKRMMFGSDWPVCSLVAEYQEAIECVERWSSFLSFHEQEDLWKNTAKNIYNL